MRTKAPADLLYNWCLYIILLALDLHRHPKVDHIVQGWTAKKYESIAMLATQTNPWGVLGT